MTTLIQEHRPRLWTIDFGLGLLLCFFFFAAFDALMPTLPLYAAAQGAVDWQIGVIVGAYGLAALGLRPLSGRATERLGTRLVVVFGCALFSLTMLTFLWLPAPPYLFVSRLVQGAGMVSFYTASTTLVADLVPTFRMGEAVAYLAIIGSVAAAVVPPLAVVVTDEWGYGVLFVACAVAVAGSLLVAIFVRTSPVVPGTTIRSPLINRSAIMPASVFFCFCLIQGPLFAFLPLFAAARSLGNPGFYFSAFGITATLVRLFIGRLSDVYGRVLIIAPSLVCGALAMFVLAAATSQEVFLASGLLYGIAGGGAYVGLLALAIDRATPQTRGSAIATFQWAWDIGSGGGAMALGVVATKVEYAQIFAIAGAFPLLGLVALLASLLKGGRRRGAT